MKTPEQILMPFYNQSHNGFQEWIEWDDAVKAIKEDREQRAAKSEDVVAKIQKVVASHVPSTVKGEHNAKNAIEDIVKILNGGQSTDREEFKDYYEVIQESMMQAFGCWLMANKNSERYSRNPEENISDIWRDFQEYKNQQQENATT